MYRLWRSRSYQNPLSNICGMCSGDSHKCDCAPPAKKKKSTKGAATSKQQPPVRRRQHHQRHLCQSARWTTNPSVGIWNKKKTATGLAGWAVPRKRCKAPAGTGQEADKMATFVREAGQGVEAYKSRLREADAWIVSLEEQLRELQQNGAALVPDVPVAAKVGRNNLDEIHRRYAKVLAEIAKKKCSLNNAYGLAGTARSTIRDFLSIAELKIVNEVTYNSIIERLAGPRTAVNQIEQECQIQLHGLLPVVKRLRTSKSLLPLAVDASFYSLTVLLRTTTHKRLL